MVRTWQLHGTCQTNAIIFTDNRQSIGYDREAGKPALRKRMLDKISLRRLSWLSSLKVLKWNLK